MPCLRLSSVLRGRGGPPSPSAKIELEFCRVEPMGREASPFATQTGLGHQPLAVNQSAALLCNHLSMAVCLLLRGLLGSIDASFDSHWCPASSDTHDRDKGTRDQSREQRC